LLLCNEYVAKIQLPGNGIWLLSYGTTGILHRVLTWLAIGD